MRKLFFILTAVFFIFPSVCGADGVFRPPNSAMQARIRALRDQVRAKGATFEVGYSAAMDKSIDQLCGLKTPPGWNKSDAPQVPMLESTLQALPPSYDWRALNGVTPIKDQKSCGDCWAFGTVGPLESQILIKDNVTVDLSEQYLNSCNTDGYSCNGGWWAHDYHMSKSGLDGGGVGAVLESAKPYTASDSACGGPYAHPYKISSWGYVGSPYAVPTVQALKQAIYTYGPIGVAIHVGPKFQAYSGGIFNTSERGSTNHAVVLVGWNDDLGTDNGYWILRNSWGSSWGEAGYMRIRYNVSQVGYSATFVEYPGAPAPTPPPPPPPTVLPDLAGGYPSLYTTNNGKTLNGFFRVWNYGTAACTTPFRVLLYLSPDGQTKSTQLATYTVNSTIQPNAYFQIKLTGITIATSMKGLYGYAVIDPDSSVTETKKTNNITVKLIPGGSGTTPAPPPAPTDLPDLAGGYPSLWTSDAGTTLNGFLRVWNYGTTACTTPFRVLFYLSNDGQTKDALLGAYTVNAAIQPNTYYQIKLSGITYASSMRGLYGYAQIDPDNAVSETSKTNDITVRVIQ